MMTQIIGRRLLEVLSYDLRWKLQSSAVRLKPKPGPNRNQDNNRNSRSGPGWQIGEWAHSQVGHIKAGDQPAKGPGIAGESSACWSFRHTPGYLMGIWCGAR